MTQMPTPSPFRSIVRKLERLESLEKSLWLDVHLLTLLAITCFSPRASVEDSPNPTPLRSFLKCRKLSYIQISYPPDFQVKMAWPRAPVPVLGIVNAESGVTRLQRPRAGVRNGARELPKRVRVHCYELNPVVDPSVELSFHLSGQKLIRSSKIESCVSTDSCGGHLRYL